MPRTFSRSISPITIANARANCDGVQVHCLRCANYRVIGFAAFNDRETIADLARRRRFRCARCGGTAVETRPNYVMKDGKRTWYGLTKAKE